MIRNEMVAEMAATITASRTRRVGEWIYLKMQLMIMMMSKDLTDLLAFKGIKN